MYIQASEGLGQWQSVTVKGGHKRSACTSPHDRERLCPIDFKVTYRSSYEDFRREVERAFGRWMTEPRARALIAKREKTLKAMHSEMPSRIGMCLDKCPVTLFADIRYRGPNGGTWRVVDVELTSWDPGWA